MANTPDREARLAQALRDNLKRRKEQERRKQQDRRPVEPVEPGAGGEGGADPPGRQGAEEVP